MSLDGPALSVVLRVPRREDTQPPEIRRKSARDQGLERSDAWLRGGAAGGVSVLRRSGPAVRRPGNAGGSRAGASSGTRSERCWGPSRADGSGAAAVSLPGLQGRAGRRAARSLAGTVVQCWGSSAGPLAVRRRREQRKRSGSDKPLTGTGRVRGRVLGDAEALGGGCSERSSLRRARAYRGRAAQRGPAGRAGAGSSRRSRAWWRSRGKSLHRRGDRGLATSRPGRTSHAGEMDSPRRRGAGTAIHRGRSGTRRVGAGKRS